MTPLLALAGFTLNTHTVHTSLTEDGLLAAEVSLSFTRTGDEEQLRWLDPTPGLATLSLESSLPQTQLAPSSQGHTLQIPHVPRGAQVTVSYTLLQAPHLDEARLPSTAEITLPEGTLKVSTQGPLSTYRLPFTHQEGAQHVSLALDEGATIDWLQVQAGPLSEAPPPAHIAVILDASLSQGPEGWAQQTELLDALVAAAPKASFAVITYSASPTWPVAAWTPASQTTLPDTPLAHGSAFGWAIAQSQIALAKAETPRPDLTLALTDGRFPSGQGALAIHELLAETPPAQLWVLLNGPEAGDLAPMARQLGGHLLRLPEHPAELAPLLLSPQLVTDLLVTTGGGQLPFLEPLPAQRAISQAWLRGPKDQPPEDIRGSLWGKLWPQIPTERPDLARHATLEALGLPGLSPDQRASLAEAAGLVAPGSAQTTTPDGLTLSPQPMAPPTEPHPVDTAPAEAWLHQALDEIVLSCVPKERHRKKLSPIHIETTREEIVLLQLGATEDTWRYCIGGQISELQLGELFAPVEHLTLDHSPIVTSPDTP